MYDISPSPPATSKKVNNNDGNACFFDGSVSVFLVMGSPRLVQGVQGKVRDGGSCPVAADVQIHEAAVHVQILEVAGHVQIIGLKTKMKEKSGAEGKKNLNKENKESTKEQPNGQHKSHENALVSLPENVYGFFKKVYVKT